MGQARIIFTDDNEITTIDVVDNVNSISDLINGGGGGGSDLIHQASITLTNAQIKSLPTTPIQIIAAQGANTIIVPVFAFFYMSWAADYTNIGDGATLGVGWGTANTSTLAPLLESMDEVGNLLADGASHVGSLSQILRINGDDSTISSLGQILDDPDEINAAVNIYAANLGSHTGNFAGGDAGNTLTVVVTYFVFNITTGAFV